MRRASRARVLTAAYCLSIGALSTACAAVASLTANGAAAKRWAWVICALTVSVLGVVLAALGPLRHRRTGAAPHRLGEDR